VPEFDGMRSAEYQQEEYDGVVIVTAHSAIDYDDLVERAEIVVDLRNATGRNGSGNGKVWKL
jgi:UDP-N-acetyl-D-mannosaminuronate dehydrogenase